MRWRAIETTHNRTKHIYIFVVHLSISLVPCFLFFVVLQIWRLRSTRLQGRSGRLGAANRRRVLRRGPSRVTGASGLKSACRTVLRIALPAGLPRRELRSISLGAAGTRERVRVSTHFLATPLGTKALNSLRPVLSTRKSSSSCCNLRR